MQIIFFVRIGLFSLIGSDKKLTELMFELNLVGFRFHANYNRIQVAMHQTSKWIWFGWFGFLAIPICVI